MTIKILGTGCKNCVDLMNNAKAAVAEMGIAATLEKVEDVQAIMAYGVMRTPAIVVDETVKSYGKVLTIKQIVELLSS